MASFRDSIKGSTGVITAVILILVACVAVYLAIFRGGASAANTANQRTFVDAETGKAFTAELKAGMTMPLVSPDSGHKTGIEAELCYWTADGKPKAVPDPVLLNQFRMPPVPGATFCPVCHRLVVAHNPGAAAGDTPPMTEAEFAASGGKLPRPER